MPTRRVREYLQKSAAFLPKSTSTTMDDSDHLILGQGPLTLGGGLLLIEKRLILNFQQHVEGGGGFHRSGVQ